jgi:phosphatidylserine synthase
MNEGLVRNKNTISGVAIVMLLLAIPSGLWPYGYYILLRWVVTAAALFVLWNAYELEKKIWVGLMGVVAILFNPIILINLDKETWVVIDFIVAGIFLLSIFRIKNYEKRKGN